MNFSQECTFLGLSTFHSNKTNKDYNKLDLHLPDKSIVTFFVDDNIKNFINFEMYSKLIVDFEVRMNNGSARINVVGICKC